MLDPLLLLARTGHLAQSVFVPLARSPLLTLASGRQCFRTAWCAAIDTAPTLIPDWTTFETIRPVHASPASVEFLTPQVQLGSVARGRKPLPG